VKFFANEGFPVNKKSPPAIKMPPVVADRPDDPSALAARGLAIM
jgi:hypothetical protein